MKRFSGVWMALALALCLGLAGCGAAEGAAGAAG